MLPDYRTRQRDYLLEIARAMTQELDLEKLLERILRLSVEILAGQAGLITLLDDTSSDATNSAGNWSIAAAHGISPEVLEHLEPLLADVSRAENQAGPDPDSDEENPDQFGTPEVNRLMQTLTQVARTNLLSGVALPLSTRSERVIGLIFVFRAYRGSFSTNDRNLLQSFANQAAIAVQNAQLYTQVRREKQRLDALLDSAADGILIMTPDHRIERCNPAFCRLWALDPARAGHHPGGSRSRWLAADGSRYTLRRRRSHSSQWDAPCRRDYLRTFIVWRRQSAQYFRHGARYHTLSGGRRTQERIYFGYQP